MHFGRLHSHNEILKIGQKLSVVHQRIGSLAAIVRQRTVLTSKLGGNLLKPLVVRQDNFIGNSCQKLLL